MEQELAKAMLKEEGELIRQYANRLSTLILYSQKENMNLIDKIIMADFLKEISENINIETYNYTSCLNNF